jgi:hypothetical protein
MLPGKRIGSLSQLDRSKGEMAEADWVIGTGRLPIGHFLQESHCSQKILVATHGSRRLSQYFNGKKIMRNIA